MPYTASEAAKAANVSTATITRALKKGILSGSKGLDGSWRIEPSELVRIYPHALQDAKHEIFTAKQDKADDLTPLHVELAAAKAALAEAREVVTDARAERDRWREMAERLALAAPVKQESRSLWQRLFGA